MDIKPHKITLRQLAEGFHEGDYDEGVVGYGGNLDIRPPYQREFIYGDTDQEAVIQTALQDYPLNVMYWADNGGGKYEVIDGQQRIISLCRFVQPNEFSITYNGKPQTFSGLPEDVRNALMDYSKFLVYTCTGTASEKLGWFQTINIAGKVLTAQEIRNAVYCGPWVASAKRYFSRPGQTAAVLAQGYFKAEVNRQALLEKAIMWHWNIPKGKIDSVMNAERDKQDADELWLGFKAIIDWAEATFPPPAKYKKEMPFVDWGELYHAHGKDELDAAKIAKRIEKLMADRDVLNNKGIFQYVLDDNEQHLQIRAFDDDVKTEVWQEQGRKCGAGKNPWDKKNCPRDDLPFEDAQADHIKPWKDGGKTEKDNCRVLCRWCNNAKRAK